MNEKTDSSGAMARHDLYRFLTQNAVFIITSQCNVNECELMQQNLFRADLVYPKSSVI
jgi:hypothetical protein